MLTVMKEVILSFYSQSSVIYFYIDRYWDSYVSYMLAIFFQWVHLIGVWYTTNWPKMSGLSRLYCYFYLCLLFTFHEFLRIFLYRIVNADAQQIKRILSHSVDVLNETRENYIVGPLGKATNMLRSFSGQIGRPAR